MSVETRIAKILIEDFGTDEGDVDSNSLLYETLGLDPLEVAELATTIEEEFGLESDAIDTSEFTTLGDLIECVKALVPAEAR